jgi:bifunctional non-homologous end joining protein LigD
VITPTVCGAGPWSQSRRPYRGVVPAPLPTPMLATATKNPPRGDGWAYEMKWDGYRAIVGIHEGRLRICSRRGLDMTARYPELEPLSDAVGVDDVVLDGELVVLDESNRPSFAAIQQHTSPATLMIFDVLRVDGRDVIDLPWRERRTLLERLALRGRSWQTPAIVEADADAALAAAGQLGLEGIVAKRIDAPYRPGKRSPAWQKTKLTNRQELVVGGWLPGEGRLSGTLGSLLVGYHDPAGVGPLVYAGRVGSGLDDAARAALASQLVARSTSPFVGTPKLAGAVWVEPDVVAEVEFSEWTDDGVLRQPVFRGLRVDKDPADVVREP